MNTEIKFKETEIGKIPETWEIIRLAEVCSKIGSGITPRGGEKVYKDSGVSLIRSQNIQNNSFSKEGLVHIDELIAKEMENVTLEKNDVLLNITGDSVARCCTVPEKILPARVNQHVSIIRTNMEQLDPIFLRYYLTTPKMQAIMLSLAQSGGTRNALTKGMIEEFIIPKPSINEQIAIAKLLYDLDLKIEMNKNTNKILQEICKSLFKHWFLDFEFPNEKDKPYKSSEGEMIYNEELEKSIPEKWSVGNLGELLINMKNQLKSGIHLKDRKYVPIDNLSMKKIGLENFLDFSEAKSSLIAFEKNDILVGAMRVYFHRVNLAPFAGITRTTTFVLRPKKEDHLAFLLFLLNEDSTINYANSHSKGTTMPYAVWDGSLSEMDIIIPDEIIMKKFNDLVNPLLEKIRDNIFEQISLSQIRDSLLPELMSGKIRVPIEVN
jgi:type I restriction enzyme S subunit